MASMTMLSRVDTWRRALYFFMFVHARDEARATPPRWGSITSTEYLSVRTHFLSWNAGHWVISRKLFWLILGQPSDQRLDDACKFLYVDTRHEERAFIRCRSGHDINRIDRCRFVMSSVLSRLAPLLPPSRRTTSAYTAALSISLALIASLISIRISVSVALHRDRRWRAGGPFLHLQDQRIDDFLAGFGGVLLTFLAGAEIGTAFREACASSGPPGVSFLIPFILVIVVASRSEIEPASSAGLPGSRSRPPRSPSSTR